MKIKTFWTALMAALLTVGLLAAPVVITGQTSEGTAVTVLGQAPDQASAQSGLIKNQAPHAVIVHDLAGYHWLFEGQYKSDVDRWRPDLGWQMAWHFAGEYTEHYTSCPGTYATQTYRCYSYNSFRDVVIDNGWPI